MGCIYYEKNVLEYNDSEHKNLLEIFKDNEIPVDGIVKVHIVSGNSLENGTVKSVSDKDVSVERFIPIGEISCNNAIKKDSTDILSLLYNSLKEEEEKTIGVAVDIGTASVVCYICNLTTKEIITIKSEKNPLAYMGDMTTDELVAHLNSKDKSEFQTALVETLYKIIVSGCREYGVYEKDITTILVSGSTLMEHLICAVDATSMFDEKHIPQSLFGIEELAASLGINLKVSLKCYISPCASYNIGGDIIAGMTYCNIDKSDKNSLYLDIGTETGIVLKRKDRYYSTAATTPAFDGVGISCGMIAESGAVHDAVVKDGEMRFSTVYEVVAEGVCGIGMVNIAAEAIKAGKLTSKGELTDGEIRINENVALTQEDFDKLFEQKKRIHSAILSLLEKAEIEMDEIDEIILSGGLGVKFNASNVCKIGAIPAILQDRIRSVLGNASGLGSVKTLVGGLTEFDRMIELSEKFV